MCCIWLAIEESSVDRDVCRIVVLAGNSACVGYANGAVKLWDLANGNVLHTWQHASMPGQWTDLSATENTFCLTFFSFSSPLTAYLRIWVTYDSSEPKGSRDKETNRCVLLVNCSFSRTLISW